ncbi:hypothetical protein PoMZ_07192, partial [Pyricularia oryzae]
LDVSDLHVSLAAAVVLATWWDFGSSSGRVAEWQLVLEATERHSAGDNFSAVRRRFCVCVCSFHPGQIGDGGGCTRRLFGSLALQVVESGSKRQVDESNAEGLCRTMDCSKSLADRYPITGIGDTGNILIGFQKRWWCPFPTSPPLTSVATCCGPSDIPCVGLRDAGMTHGNRFPRCANRRLSSNCKTCNNGNTIANSCEQVLGLCQAGRQRRRRRRWPNKRR